MRVEDPAVEVSEIGSPCIVKGLPRAALFVADFE